jgi:hypothetical protein
MGRRSIGDMQSIAQDINFDLINQKLKKLLT